MRREIGGRELQMRYTFNSLCAMEERAGGGLAQWNNRQYTPVRLLFWGALIDRQPEITLTEAGNLIGGHIASGGTLEQIALRGARQGLGTRREILEMTPRELEEARQRREAWEEWLMEKMDALAWLVGQYVAVALHAPERYPLRPDRATRNARTPEEMRQVLMRMAERSGADERHP